MSQMLGLHSADIESCLSTCQTRRLFLLEKCEVTMRIWKWLDWKGYNWLESQTHLTVRHLAAKHSTEPKSVGLMCKMSSANVQWEPSIAALLLGACTSNGVPESLESVSAAYDEGIHSWFSVERKIFRCSSFVEVTLPKTSLNPRYCWSCFIP